MEFNRAVKFSSTYCYYSFPKLLSDSILQQQQTDSTYWVKLCVGINFGNVLVTTRVGIRIVNNESSELARWEPK